MAKNCPIRNSGRWDIARNALFLILPMVLLTVALVGYVLWNQVKSGEEGSPVFVHPPTVLAHDSIYVDVSSARLVFLASWISSIAPLLTGFLINLATYPIAQRLFEDAATQTRAENLPTAFQLSLMLMLINGSTWGGFWGLIQYSLNWKHRIDRRAAALTYLALATGVAVLLSALVFSADTWLHLSTKTVPLNQTTAIPTYNVPYSLEPLSLCMTTNNSLTAMLKTNTSCTVRPSLPLPWSVFVNPVATMETVSNQSSSTSVLYDADTNLSYLNPSFDSLDPTLNFVASRYAVRTMCKPIAKACNLANNGNVTFNCNNGTFEADGDEMNGLGFAKQVFTTQNMSDTDDPINGVQNPFYITVATINRTPKNSTLPKDPDLVPTNTGIAGIFSCSVTLFDVQYAYSQGRVYDLSKIQSSTNITNMFASGIVVPLQFGFHEMIAALNLAATSARTAQEFANDMALTLSNSVLSSAAGSVQVVPAHMAQRTSVLLVSKVSKWPFGLLIGINIAFISLGLLITTLAAMTSHEGRQVQYRLTVAGIVANLFDRENARGEWTKVEQLFGEYHGNGDPVRVKIDRTSKAGFAWSAVGLPSSEVVIREVPDAHMDERSSSVSSPSPSESRHESSFGGKESSTKKQVRWSWMY